MEEPYRSLLDPPKGEGPHQAMMALGMAHEMLAAFDWQEFLRAANHWDAAGWLYDPTKFRDSLNSDGWRQTKKLAEAAVAFVSAVGAIKAEMAPGK